MRRPDIQKEGVQVSLMPCDTRLSERGFAGGTDAVRRPDVHKEGVQVALMP